MTPLKEVLQYVLIDRLWSKLDTRSGVNNQLVNRLPYDVQITAHVSRDTAILFEELGVQR